ncbi:unnamed protein product [Phytomonas sp. EM1]|nr:unnamed protein product [Phytomonas sp. EM1]|eukprot:CCW63617.1 unnamed protein product [Phytomonas sp. isolate EM1]
MQCENDLTAPVAPEVKIPILNANRKLHLTGAMTNSIFSRITPENMSLPLQRELKVFECSDGAEPRKRLDVIMKNACPASSDTLHCTPLSLSLRHHSRYCHGEKALSSNVPPPEFRIPKRSPSPEPAPPTPSSRESLAQEIKVPSMPCAHPTAAPTELKRSGESIATGLLPERLDDETFVTRLVGEVHQGCTGAVLSGHNSHEGGVQAAVGERGAAILCDRNSHAEISSRSGSPSPHVLAVESHDSCSACARGTSYSPRAELSSCHHYPPSFPSTKSQSFDVHTLKGENRLRVVSSVSPVSGVVSHNSAQGHSEAQLVESVEGRGSHPTWEPHPIKEPRPAWNQRIPPSKLRPVVSAVGNKPPPRRSLSLSRAHAARGEEIVARTDSLRSQSRSNVGPDERLKTASGRALAEGSPSLRYHPQPKRANQSKSRPASVTPRAMNDVASPPVRILFRSQSARERSTVDVTSPRTVSGRSSTSLNGNNIALDSILKQLQLAQQSAQIAVERATRAEACCAELERQLRESEMQRRRDREDFALNFSRLSGKVNFAVQWIHSYERYPVGLEDRLKKETSEPIHGEDGVRFGDKEYQDSTPGVQGTTPTPERSITSVARLPLSSPMVFEMRS